MPVKGQRNNSGRQLETLRKGRAKGQRKAVGQFKVRESERQLGGRSVKGSGGG